MPSSSKKQKTLSCIALSMKMGKTAESYSKEGARMMKSMSKQQLEDMCKMPMKKS